MVKHRSFVKHVARTIRESFSRFLAIFAIVALGVGFLAGLLASTPDMRQSVGVYCTDSRLMDLRVVGNLGLEESDLEALRAVEGVESAVGGKQLDCEVVTEEGDTLVARVHSVPDGMWDSDDPAYINRLTLRTGRWPQAPNEIVIEAQHASNLELNEAGATLVLAAENEDLSLSAFTIVGTVRNSYYLSAVQRGTTSIGNGRLSSIIYLSESVFTTDYYTDLFAIVAGADGEAAFSDAYDAHVDEVLTRVETLADSQKYVRREHLVDEANDALREAQEEFDEKRADGERELADALAELEDGERELADALLELEDGERQYADGLAELADGRREFDDAIADAERELADGEQEYQDGLAELADALLELEDGERQYLEGSDELRDGQRELDEAKQTLDDALAEILDGERQLAEGREQYENGRADLRRAAAQLEDGRAQLALGEATLTGQLAALRRSKSDGLQAIQNDPTGQALYGVLSALAQQLTEMGQPVPAELTLFLQGLEYAIGLGTVDAGLIGTGAALYSGLMDGMISATESQGTAKLDEARADLAAGEAAYASGAAQLRAARREIEENEALLADARAEWEDGKQQWLDGLAELDEGVRELRDARTELDDGWAEYHDAVQTLADARVELDDGARELREARIDGARELRDAERELRDARTELDDGWAEYHDGLAELADGRAEYEDGLDTFEREVQDAQDKLDEAREDVAAIEAPEWYVLTRAQNPGYAFYESDTLKVESIAKVFPIFFFAVAALVASTTMTRMIEEQRGQIGTLKALGYGNGAIAAKYLIYAGAAGLCGSAAGLVVGLRLFPSVIYNAYKLMYYLPPLRYTGSLQYGTIATVIILAAILASTYLALRGALRSRASELMRPKAPPPGKRILLERVGPLWRRMRFTHKVTARNLFRYKKRFLMTVIGISGCTALLLTGFGLRDSINDIVRLQFGELQNYNLTVGLKNTGDAEADRRLRAVFAEGGHILDYTAVHMEACTGVSPAGETDLYVIIPQDDARLPDFFVFRDRVSGETIPFSQEGALLTEKAAKSLGLSVGDALTLRRGDDAEAAIPIAGIIENYVQGYLYLPHELYERGYGEDCEYNTLLCRADDESDADRDALSTAILESPRATSVEFSTTVVETFSDMLGSIDSIVVVLILSAGALAFVVLYNLTNINITERQKELATIKVLGFRAGEVDAYVFRETALLSLIGLAAGLVIGIFLHIYVVQTAEVDAVMFGRTIQPMSYVYSAAITLLFTALVCFVMRFRLRAVDMVESLKAPE